jgi:hypothetical protein
MREARRSTSCVGTERPGPFLQDARDVIESGVESAKRDEDVIQKIGCLLQG